MTTPSGKGANGNGKPAVVLVHGAFADASGWGDVIRALQKKGYDVTAVASGAADNPNVKAIVYVAAFAPDVGETLGPLLQKFPSQVDKSFRPDAAGFIYLDRETFHDVFCQDLPEDEASVLAATQKPLSGSVFEAKPTVAAWKGKPTWFIVAKGDHVIHPDLERFFAKRMGAKTTEVDASHVAFMSHPDVIVNAIEAAAA